MSLFRIGANIQAMDSLRSLYGLNKEIGTRQARLSSGKRINTAQDDTAGYSIAKSLEARRNGLSTALSNVENAKNVLAIAEGGYQNQMDILQTIKSKAVQAADGAISPNQRKAIDLQVFQLLTEFDEIALQTKWSGTSMINPATNEFSFHVGGDKGEELKVALSQSNSAVTTYASGGVALNQISSSTGGGKIGTDLNGADDSIATVDASINALAGFIQTVGDTMVRLGKKSDFLSVSSNNTDAVRSQYEDADFAVEQMELLKLQILQQTSVSALSQANSGPAVVLKLFSSF